MGISGGGDAINIGDISWLPFRFSELETNDLFWFETTRQAKVHRKLDDNTALNLKDQTVIEMPHNPRVYQKEY